MYTLATKYDRRLYLKDAAIYGAIGAFCILFSYIYSLFSHEVTSPYMTYMCVYPLLLGTLLSLVLWTFKLPRPSRVILNAYSSGIAALTVGSCIHGIMFIAGTSTPFQSVYTFGGLGLVGAGIFIYIIGLIRRH